MKKIDPKDARIEELTHTLTMIVWAANRSDDSDRPPYLEVSREMIRDAERILKANPAHARKRILKRAARDVAKIQKNITALSR